MIHHESSRLRHCRILYFLGAIFDPSKSGLAFRGRAFAFSDQAFWDLAFSALSGRSLPLLFVILSYCLSIFTHQRTWNRKAKWFCWPFYPRDAMLARVFATATCLSVRLSHAGIVPKRAKAGLWNVHLLIAPSLLFLGRYDSSKNSQGVPQRSVPNEGVGFFQRFSTNMSSYLENGAF